MWSACLSPQHGPWGEQMCPTVTGKSPPGRNRVVSNECCRTKPICPWWGPALHTRRNCTWNKLPWQLDSKGRQETFAGPPCDQWAQGTVHRHSCSFLIPAESWGGSDSGCHWRPSQRAKLRCQRQRPRGHEKGRCLYTGTGGPWRRSWSTVWNQGLCPLCTGVWSAGWWNNSSLEPSPLVVYDPLSEFYFPSPALRRNTWTLLAGLLWNV